MKIENKRGANGKGLPRTGKSLFGISSKEFHVSKKVMPKCHFASNVHNSERSNLVNHKTDRLNL